MKSTEMMNRNMNPGAAAGRIELSSDSSSDLGLIKIHDNVLAALVSRAVLGVEGVSRLAGSAIIDNLAGMVGSHSRAIEIIKDNEEKIRIVVKVNIFFGTVIPKVAMEVQHQVIEQVESAAGLTVNSVDVVVQQLDEKVEYSDDDDDDEDAAPGVDALAASRAALSGLPGIG